MHCYWDTETYRVYVDDPDDPVAENIEAAEYWQQCSAEACQMLDPECEDKPHSDGGLDWRGLHHKWAWRARVHLWLVLHLRAGGSADRTTIDRVVFDVP